MSGLNLSIPMVDESGNLIKSRAAKDIRRTLVKDMMTKDNIRVQYIRDTDGLSPKDKRVLKMNGFGGNPVGVVVAKLVDNKLYVGWSLLHKKDSYDRDFGILQAMSRLSSVDSMVNNKNIPNAVRRNVAYLVARSLCYFKGK
jgi:hypothetical protein